MQVQKFYIQSFLSLLVELANPFPYVVYCNVLRKCIMVVWQNVQITLENICFINIIFVRELELQIALDVMWVCLILASMRGHVTFLGKQTN